MFNNLIIDFHYNYNIIIIHYIIYFTTNLHLKYLRFKYFSIKKIFKFLID